MGRQPTIVVGRAHLATNRHPVLAGRLLWGFTCQIQVSGIFLKSVTAACGLFNPYESDSHALIGRRILPWIIGACNLHFRLISNLHIF